MKRIGIIRGGDWNNYERSLQDGADLISFINKNLPDKYTPVDILIDRQGVWYIKGLSTEPHDIVHHADIFWNFANPATFQILNDLSLPHAGVSPFPNALQESREMLREHMMKSIGLNMPRHLLLPGYQRDFDESIEAYAGKRARAVFEKFGSPWIVRSLSGENAMGVHVAKTYPELVRAIIDGAEHSGSILVEELIPGKEVGVHSLRNFRGEDTYIFPGELKGEEKENLYTVIKNMHHSTGSDYLKSLFILHPRGEVYLKSLEFSPDFGADSDLHNASESIGAKAHHILESILENRFN